MPTILNNEDLDKEFQGLNRDIFAMHSSKGVAKGTIQSVSANIDQFTAIQICQPDSFISDHCKPHPQKDLYSEIQR